MPATDAPPYADGLFDELIADAWPPAVTERLGQWRLRWAWGITRRANSVLAVGDPGCPLDEAVNLAEDFYVQYQQPPRFQLSGVVAAQTLAELLERRGYTREAPTLIQAAPASSVTAFIDSREWDVELSAHPRNEWFTAYWAAGGKPLDGVDRQLLQDRHRSTLLRPATDSLFVDAARDGIPTSVGQGVVQGPWVGVQCMATLPHRRREGAASAVLRAIGGWAQSRSIANIYLAVMEDNDAARQLYALAGFGDVGRYAYWTHGSLER